MNPEMDAIYILSPKENIVEILINDFERRRYKEAYLVWTGVLDPRIRRMIDGCPPAKQRIAGFETLSIDFFPRESHLITFKDPWSFPILYHPACNNLVARHMKILAQKVRSRRMAGLHSLPLLTTRADYRCMRYTGRVPKSPILQTEEPSPRSRRACLSFGSFRAGGVGRICAVEPKLSTTVVAACGNTRHHGQVNGYLGASGSRVHISGNGSRSSPDTRW